MAHHPISFPAVGDPAKPSGPVYEKDVIQWTNNTGFEVVFTQLPECAGPQASLPTIRVGGTSLMYPIQDKKSKKSYKYSYEVEVRKKPHPVRTPHTGTIDVS